MTTLSLRTALAIKRKTLSGKLQQRTSRICIASEVALDDETIHRLDGALTKLTAFEKLPADATRLNKASVFTWLMFNVRANWTHRDALPEDALAQSIHYFNFVRKRLLPFFKDYPGLRVNFCGLANLRL